MAFTTHPYEVDEEHLEATHVAESLDEPIEQVYKTLVLRGERTGLFVCVIAGNMEVDLKAAARAAGDKKCDLIAMRELLPLTGYIRGGCSPVGMKKPLRTFFDAAVLEQPHIYVSAGRRGLQLCLKPQDLIDFCKAQTVDNLGVKPK